MNSVSEQDGSICADTEILMLSQLDAPFARLETLPSALVPQVVTHSSGFLPNRIDGVLQLRESLLEGKLPKPVLVWPEPIVQKWLFTTLGKYHLPRYCIDNVEVVDALLVDILQLLENKQPEYMHLYAVLFEQYKEQELERLKQEMARRKRKKTKKTKLKLPSIEHDRLVSLQRQASEQSWIVMVSSPDDLLPQIWSERLAVWQQLEEVFTDLQMITRLGFDLSKGLLQSHGWLNMVKLRKVIKTLPQLQRVIRTLGRMKQVEGQPIVETILSPMRVSKKQMREVNTPFVPMETRGITRSDSINRMLPQEAALLGHPVLKVLWHAKRAEHALLSYAVEGTDLESYEEEVEERVEQTRTGKQKNMQHGPIIICLDTSGSMAGTPENIAKAIVLECLSVAAQEKRGCYVYLFGSSNEVKELELQANDQGLTHLISFLSMSFGGGTDVKGPLEMALDRCKKTQWENADLLLVTDGAFSCSESLINRIKRRKKSHALSVHGILIGSHSSAMKKLCDPLHKFSEWLDLAP